jgi:hypothetical protein
MQFNQHGKFSWGRLRILFTWLWIWKHYEQIHFLAIILIILPSFFMFANRKLSV